MAREKGIEFILAKTVLNKSYVLFQLGLTKGLEYNYYSPLKEKEIRNTVLCSHRTCGRYIYLKSVFAILSSLTLQRPLNCNWYRALHMGEGVEGDIEETEWHKGRGFEIFVEQTGTSNNNVPYRFSSSQKELA